MRPGFLGGAPAIPDAVGRKRLHRRPQALLFVLQFAIVFGTHQQIGSIGMSGGHLKEFVEVGLAVADADQRGVRAASLDRRHRPVAF